MQFCTSTYHEPLELGQPLAYRTSLFELFNFEQLCICVCYAPVSRHNPHPYPSNSNLAHFPP